MGNCLRHRPQTTLGGDDWDFAGSEKLYATDMAHDKRFENVNHKGEMENVSLLGEKHEISSTEIKIKLTKKQMEELLAEVGMRGMSIERVLTQLVNKGGDCHLRHRAWRPALQSIPEVN
ncbi:hypothetical protein AAC387_Pa01g2642 [Persea americana]